MQKNKIISCVAILIILVIFALSIKHVTKIQTKKDKHYEYILFSFGGSFEYRV